MFPGHGQVHGKVSQAVENRYAAVDFDAFQDVRVVTENQIGSGIDCGVRYLALIVGNHGGNEMNSPMHRDHGHVNLALQSADVRCQGAQVVLIGPGVHAARGSWLVMLDLLVVGPGPHGSAAGPVRFRPVGHGENRVVGEHSDAPAAGLDDHRSAGLSYIGSHAGDRKPG